MTAFAFHVSIVKGGLLPSTGITLMYIVSPRRAIRVDWIMFEE